MLQTLQRLLQCCDRGKAHSQRLSKINVRIKIVFASPDGAPEKLKTWKKDAGPFATPASSPDQEGSSHTDIGTSSISSSDAGASPFLASRIFEGLKQDNSSVSDGNKSFFGYDSDSDSVKWNPLSMASSYSHPVTTADILCGVLAEAAISKVEDKKRVGEKRGAEAR